MPRERIYLRPWANPESRTGLRVPRWHVRNPKDQQEQAADQGTSVSKFVGKVIEDRMRSADGYRRAFATVKRIKPIPGFDASKRLSREQLYDRP